MHIYIVLTKSREAVTSTRLWELSLPLNYVFSQIVVPQACAERPDPAAGPAGGVEILALCETVSGVWP